MDKRNNLLAQMVVKHGKNMLSIPKALAYFLLRELIEDIHADGRISQDEMKELNQRAVNRAELFINLMFDKDKGPFTVLVLAQNLFTKEWDKPQETEEIAKNRAFYRLKADELFGVRDG
jgi:hypothetical protein